MTADRPPPKRWRVYGARGLSTDYRARRDAYDLVETITRNGVKATVYRWENGSWRLYERIDPPKETGQ